MYEPNYSSILEYLLNSSKMWGDREAFVTRRRVKKEKVLYRDIPNLLEKYVTWFSTNNIYSGEKILFWGMNCPEYALTLLATISLGRVAVPIDWRNSTETINKIIEKTKPQVAFISKYFKYDFIEEKAIRVFFIEDVLAQVNMEQPSQIKNNDYTDYDRIVEVVFTSGTTGVPKGVVMKQKNILANLKTVEASLPDLTDSRTISILPLSHMLEQIAGLLLPIGYGTTIYYLPRINSFRLLQSFSEYKPTHLVLVPQMLKMFWEKIEDKASQNGRYKNLEIGLRIGNILPRSIKRWLFSQIHNTFGGKLRFIACGGAPLDKQIGENWMKIGIPIIEGYGATEVTAIATINNVKKPKLGTVGKPVTGVEVTLDKDGEIYIQSESLSAGYFEDIEKTEAVFTLKGYRTGDIGEFDSQGYLRIKGRDIFKIVLPSGEKVFVEDVETKVLQDKRVKECCIVAIRTSGGDKIHAYLILKKDTTDTLKEIIASINGHLESKQQILSFDLWPNDDFPRTPTLKVDRKRVSEVANNQKGLDFVANEAVDTAFGITDVTDVLSKVSGIHKDKILETDTLAGDLNIDSLTRVEVVALSEEYLGVILDEGKINAKTTVKELKLMAKDSVMVEEVKIPTWQFTKLGQLIHYLATSWFLVPLHSLIIKIKYPQKALPIINPSSVIIFNHPGILDGVCVIRTLLKQNRYLLVTNSASSFWTNNTIFAKPLEIFVGGIPLYESGHKLMKILQTDADLLDQGYNLLFAPQGGLQISPEEKPFKLGVGYIIQQLDCPVTIVKINGYYDIWPVSKKGFENSKLIDFLPKKTGTVDVKISTEIKMNWKDLTPIQITNLLEEKYREL